KTIDSLVDPIEMVNYKNGHIKYFNKKFDSGAEVDQVLQFYGQKPFINLVNDLSKKEYLSVFSDTPKPHF
ncbi:MAG: hypothetical protein KC535_03420, partial [Nanoarchaeota archaeon]|nr:hypothetical protein [Nanoarchaeota archaeon]